MRSNGPYINGERASNNMHCLVRPPRLRQRQGIPTHSLFKVIGLLLVAASSVVQVDQSFVAVSATRLHQKQTNQIRNLAQESQAEQ